MKIDGHTLTGAPNGTSLLDSIAIIECFSMGSTIKKTGEGSAVSRMVHSFHNQAAGILKDELNKSRRAT